MENENQNTNQQPTTQPADPGDKGSTKMFTQEDVDRIVRDRLNRSKNKAPDQDPAQLAEKETALAEREASLTARESRLSCREYLVDSGYPAELLDVVDTSNINEFKKKADTVARLMNQIQYPTGDPLANLDYGPYTGANAFGNQPKHTPRQYPPRCDD